MTLRSVLVTGGAGFIGSHMCVELLSRGDHVAVVDNLCNSNQESLRRVQRITGRSVDFVRADVRDQVLLDAVFSSRKFDAVIHFAGLKAVGESVERPIDYYENNVQGTLALLRAMERAGVRTLVFSSSATVYGDPERVPIREDFPLKVTNPYGRSKLMVCDILRDLSKSDPRWRFALLRYFNPVGAHESGLIGEDPAGVPNNLMPYVAQVAVGKLPQLSIFGDDYPTTDGTGVRDYIHVVDLARGHLKALDVLERGDRLLTVNLGTGKGYSVLDIVKAFERASGRPVPYRIAPRRPGDVAACYADPSLARTLLGWTAEYDIDRMCADHWRWQSMNPDGFGS
ncbi:MAG: UDP-glucose 4-epimerase GalE [Betaproteobacteria bacterium]|nr:UDP-glucose 4-epimerase GalE [Betaproteobacteria bacterium]